MDISSEINADLAAIIGEKSPEEAINRFRQLLVYLQGKPAELIIDTVSKISNAISQDVVTVISARQICGELISHIDGFSDDHLIIAAFQVLLSRMQSRIIAFEAQLVELRDLLAGRLAKAGNLREAAMVLSAMPLESGQRQYSNEYKLDIYLRIVETYLDLNDLAQVEFYINRASLLQSECQDLQRIVRYKTAYARLLDLKQKFLEAGQRYAELSIRYPGLVSEGARMNFLERALVSALLAGAGQQRARLLATLYKDERCQALSAFPILEKMHMRRLISREALQGLHPLLIQYYPQLFNADGDRKQELAEVLERVVVEHNVLAASLIYNAITLTNLAELLGVEVNQAETIAAQMISEERLVAQIDQIEGVVHFDKDNSTIAGSSMVQCLWNSINRILEGVEADHPAWVAAHSA